MHGGERSHQATDAVTTPIYQTSTFWFPDSETLAAYQEGRAKRDEYGRYGNPTWRAVERKLCELEGAEAAALTASGMCAATTLFLALLPRSGHLIVTSDCYRRTRQFIEQYLTKLDVETTVIDPSDTKQLADAIRPNTRLFFTESPTNPYLRVIDVRRGRARLPRARRRGGDRQHVRDAGEPPRARRRRRLRDPQRDEVSRRPQRPARRRRARQRRST